MKVVGRGKRQVLYMGVSIGMPNKRHMVALENDMRGKVFVLLKLGSVELS